MKKFISFIKFLFFPLSPIALIALGGLKVISVNATMLGLFAVCGIFIIESICSIIRLVFIRVPDIKPAYAADPVITAESSPIVKPQTKTPEPTALSPAPHSAPAASAPTNDTAYVRQRRAERYDAATSVPATQKTAAPTPATTLQPPAPAQNAPSQQTPKRKGLVRHGGWHFTISVTLGVIIAFILPTSEWADSVMAMARSGDFASAQAQLSAIALSSIVNSLVPQLCIGGVYLLLYFFSKEPE